MNGFQRIDGTLAAGGVRLDAIADALATLEPHADAFYVYDLDQFEARARAYQNAFAPLDAFAAYAMKANGLPALLERLAAVGFGADAGSLGELHVARASGIGPEATLLNGNGRTLAEARWAATHGIRLVNADLAAELDLLDRAAGEAGRRLRVALRVNPNIATPGHRYVATGDDEAKFGLAPEEALEAWGARARWSNLDVDGIHLHIGSQILDTAPLLAALRTALDLADAAAARGAPLGLVNLGGGLGVDYEGEGRTFPLDTYAATVVDAARGRSLEWVLEPGRWLVAPVGALVARVRWVKRRGARRFVVLGAGMNDFIRPALYGARHRIVPVRARAGDAAPATVVGPVCESGDVFAAGVPLPPVEPGDWVALLDTGAYGAAMASTYNGRGRLPEVVVGGGAAVRARAGETPEDLLARRRDDRLSL